MRRGCRGLKVRGLNQETRQNQAQKNHLVYSIYRDTFDSLSYARGVRDLLTYTHRTRTSSGKKNCRKTSSGRGVQAEYPPNRTG